VNPDFPLQTRPTTSSVAQERQQRAMDQRMENMDQSVKTLTDGQQEIRDTQQEMHERMTEIYDLLSKQEKGENSQREQKAKLKKSRSDFLA
jgi:hypothetical protein